MKWNVEFTDEFGGWWDTLSQAEQKSVAFTVGLLEIEGPGLRFPYSSKTIGSIHSGMRELRSQCEGRPLRTFYVFDPRRNAILLIGGDKTGDDRFYEVLVPRADEIYKHYLSEIEEE
ncbi:type II toxin-antitoxin system RelE/ParE family toxin [Brucepastera parasyntrophica]|uniref:type II toxin-antitoxin system RelE/ParE family toxin n=1 Tax=Brucepastera parasyntrophica TaxID=2880008 RepID=UPI00210ABCCE|nr:type II toxin-antitoxin system RelE/ParE family toxin [Brucepastera parasyntrophica]ULQ60750.1 type II toxin-antitoxin system RelE/ParE family toxin [Brucepastera parasyntrophica]